MSEVWLSPHVDARFGQTPGEVLFSNSCYGTRIISQETSWELLKGYSSPGPSPTDPWLVRAQKALLLLSEDEAQHPDFILRLETQLKDYVAEHAGQRPETSSDKTGLLELLDLAESIFREKHMPKPYSGPPQSVGPLMEKPSRLVNFIFDHTRAFLTHDLEDRSKDLDIELVHQFFARPAMKLRYEQQYCIPRTTQLRAQKIIDKMPEGSRILVMGDDDLVALALIHMTDKLKVDVLELDADLVAFLKDKGQDKLTVLEHNLRHGVPDSMKNAYDLVTTDPPYAKDGMRFFLQCAKESLARTPESRLMLTTFPGLLEDPDKLWNDLKELHLDILHTDKHFSRYMYNNEYRVQHLAALRYLGSPVHPTSELMGFPYLYAHFFECAHNDL